MSELGILLGIGELYDIANISDLKKKLQSIQSKHDSDISSLTQQLAGMNSNLLGRIQNLVVADCIVFNDGGNAVAVDGRTKQVVASNSNHSAVLQAVVDQYKDIVIVGEFTISAPITITKDNVVLRGLGGHGWHLTLGRTIIRNASGDYAIKVIGVVNGVRIENITIDGNGSGSGIYMERVFGTVLRNISIVNALDGIKFNPWDQTNTYAYASFIRVENPNMWNVRRGITLTAGEGGVGYRTEAVIIDGGAIYGDPNNYGEYGIYMDKVDFITVRDTLVAFMDRGFHINCGGWVTLARPKIEAVNYGIRVEDGYVSIVDYHAVNINKYDVQIYYNALNKVKVVSTTFSSAGVAKAKGPSNTLFDTYTITALPWYPDASITNLHNVSVIEAGPVDTFQLILRSFVGVTGETIKLQTLNSAKTTFLDRLTIENAGDIVNLYIKNSYLNVLNEVKKIGLPLLTDTSQLPASGDYKGQVYVVRDSTTNKWVLKVWDGSTWQTIG